MDSYRRSQVTDVIRRLKEPPRHIITIFGPRQTGKTTLVQQALSSSNLEHTYLSADEPVSLIPVKSQPVVWEFVNPFVLIRPQPAL